MRTGEVSFVTPFRYFRLVFALILAVVVFHERPDMAVLVGAALIAAAGVYTMLRGNRVCGGNRRAPAPSPIENSGIIPP